MDIPLIDHDSFSVVIEYDAVDAQQTATTGTLAYEITSDHAGAAAMEALIRVSEELKKNWRDTARLMNVRVSVIYLTDEVRQAIAQHEAAAQEPVNE